MALVSVSLRMNMPSSLRARSLHNLPPDLTVCYGTYSLSVCYGTPQLVEHSPSIHSFGVACVVFVRLHENENIAMGWAQLAEQKSKR